MLFNITVSATAHASYPRTSLVLENEITPERESTRVQVRLLYDPASALLLSTRLMSINIRKSECSSCIVVEMTFEEGTTCHCRKCLAPTISATGAARKSRRLRSRPRLVQSGNDIPLE